MKIELNAKALAAVSDLCNESTLETNIALMEDSIDMLLSDEFPEESERVQNHATGDLVNSLGTLF